MFDRRTFLKTGAACAAFAASGARAQFAHAALPDDRRFVVIILRGGLDGLAAVPAHGDPDYAAARSALALPKSGGGAPIDLDGFFGLHPSLHNLAEMWGQKELAIFHNVSTPYRDRSHFDAQNVLETGGMTPHRLSEGWLNRALRPLALDGGNGALAVASSPPLLLEGPSRVTSWIPSRMPAADEDFLNRVAQLYARDATFSTALNQGLETRAVAARATHDMPNASRNANGGYGGIASLMEGAGRILAAERGPRIAVFDITGWDTHFNQGAGEGQLSRRLGDLDGGLAALKAALAETWNKTAIVAASEFGRTVATNGTGGTDHGTASVAFVMGGAVAGGAVHAEWKGLKSVDLREGRDLPAMTDTRAIFKGVLADHLGVARKSLEDLIFPDSAAAVARKGILRV
jgi:uncharacterized protein (DUF1501 family)